jgi:hypothetical protein
MHHATLFTPFLQVKGYLKALPRAANFIATSDSKAVALLPAETPRNELWAGWTRILAVPPRKVRAEGCAVLLRQQALHVAFIHMLRALFCVRLSLCMCWPHPCISHTALLPCPALPSSFPSLQWAQLLRLELHYEEAHESIASAHGPYYYLSFIGTAPEARGRGLGSKLLAEITGRADREGRWCLLEATSQKSEVRRAEGAGGLKHFLFSVCSWVGVMEQLAWL